MKERAILVGVFTGRRLSDERLSELGQLASTAGAEVVTSVEVKRTKIDPRFYIGSGKVEEIGRLVSEVESNIIIFDCDLSPAQQHNLEEITGVKVIDRTQLILDIFARRARTSEGKLQIELAQLTYLLPRLTGRGVELSRLAGGIGIRGPGEMKLEVDRREIRRRITKLKSEIREVRRHRAIQRESRGEIPSVALIGYTNSGKSTLLKSLTGAKVAVGDKLFSTLDPTIRRITLPENIHAVVIDTVGFIRELPHRLIAAFKATLEEVSLSDLLLHMVDASHPRRKEHRDIVLKIIGELGAENKPVLTVLNKIDLVRKEDEEYLCREFPGCVTISALQKTGFENLLNSISRCLSVEREIVNFRIPQKKSEIVALLHKMGHVISEEYTSGHVVLEVEVSKALRAQLREYE